MDTHVKVLGVLHIAMGAIGVVLSLLLMAIFGGVAGIVGASGGPDRLALRGAPRWMIALIAAPFAAIGLFLSLAAIGSFTRREGLNRLAAAVGVGGVGMFIVGAALFLTYDSLAPGGGMLRRGIG